MVDSFDLFCRLSRGAKYDKQRLSKELAVFKVSSPTPTSIQHVLVLWRCRAVPSNWIGTCTLITLFAEKSSKGGARKF